MNRYFWLLFAVSSLAASHPLRAQDLLASTVPIQTRAHHTPDYGYQVVERYLPDEAPLGFTSIAISKLTAPMIAGRTYHLRYTLQAEPFAAKSYRLAPVVIPTVGIDLPYEYEVPQDELQPSGKTSPLIVGKTLSARTKQVFEVTIIPQADYEYLTFLVPEGNLQGIRLEPRVDIAVTGIYLDVDPAPRTPPNFATLPGRPWAPLATQSAQGPLAIVALPSIPPSDAGATGSVPTSKMLASLEPARRKHRRERVQHEERVAVSTRTIRIGLYDNKRIDGDIVTILVNDRILVEHHLLTKAPAYLEVELAPGPNTLVLHAENLGAVVPNTAAVIIEAGGQTQEVVLSSNLEQSEVVEIDVE